VPWTPGGDFVLYTKHAALAFGVDVEVGDRALEPVMFLEFVGVETVSVQGRVLADAVAGSREA